MIEMKVVLHTFLKKVIPRVNEKVKIKFTQGFVFQPEDDNIVYLDLINDQQDK